MGTLTLVAEGSAFFSERRRRRGGRPRARERACQGQSAASGRFSGSAPGADPELRFTVPPLLRGAWGAREWASSWLRSV